MIGQTPNSLVSLNNQIIGFIELVDLNVARLGVEFGTRMY